MNVKKIEEENWNEMNKRKKNYCMAINESEEWNEWVAKWG